MARRAKPTLAFALALAAVMPAAGGCSGYFTSQVRQAGLRQEVRLVRGPGGVPTEQVRLTRSPGGRAAQLLLPGAWLLDGAVEATKVVNLFATVAGWTRVVP